MPNSKYRVFELAKEFGTQSKVILDILARNNMPVKNHMSSVDENGKELIVRTFARKADVPVVAAPAAADKPPAAKPQKVSPEEKHGLGRSEAQQRKPADIKTPIRPAPPQHGAAAAPIARKAYVPAAQTPAGKKDREFFRPKTEQRNQQPIGGAANRQFADRPPAQAASGQGAPPRAPFAPKYRPEQQNRPRNNFAPQAKGTQAVPGRTPFGAQKQASEQAAQPQRKFDGPHVPGRRPPSEQTADTSARGTDSHKKPPYNDRRKNRHSEKKFPRGEHPESSKNLSGKPPRAGAFIMPPASAQKPSKIQIPEAISVKDFAAAMKREVPEIIKTLMRLGVLATINQEIDFDTATLAANEFKVEVLPLPPEQDPTELPEVEDDPKKRVHRAPVVTIMGHVDHGKTSLLDTIRKTNVTAREAGGITQHIGAYQVNYQGKKIVFLDTPGHEAFTSMRARGAKVTDIAILVVAADDGVMPQTVEAINHAKAAEVPIIVAINKMDKPNANPDRVKQQLSEQGILAEDWGGQSIMVPVSAHKNVGITDLLEMILLVAEMQELTANPGIPAQGTIIEAELDKGRGPVATVLVQKGTLRIGDSILAGTAYGKVRAMINERGESVKKAGPSTPVEVQGLSDVPMAGDILNVTDERIARSIADKRVAKKRLEDMAASSRIKDIKGWIDAIEKRKELNIVIKADVQGTIEALCQSLEGIKNEEVKVVLVHSGVGGINESDVMLASASNALIIGFNVRPDGNARKTAESEKVDIRTYRVIYDALNDVEAAIKGMLAPKYKEAVQGRVEIRQIITISKSLIAGCYVVEGKINRSCKVRILRDNVVVHEGELESLRRFKDDVREVMAGFECGLTIEKFRDVKEGDVIEAYIMEEVKPE
ncbi:MAG: translation initiation factor IF-2 [Acidaminococcales bacterium]|jgi:translation initiation factor IF-2|nr:translation initiation factor IF-2 [Acidaminococcales bacterium]